MAPAAKKVLTDALVLPLADRAQIAAELLASLEGEPEPDVAAAWAAEIEHRARKALEPNWQGEDWSVVRARIRAER